MSDSTPPIKLSNATIVRMPLALLVGLIGACLGASVAAAMAWSNMSVQVAEIPGIKLRLDAHDAALSRMAVMANDIEWMRHYLEVPPRPKPAAGN